MNRNRQLGPANRPTANYRLNSSRQCKETRVGDSSDPAHSPQFCRFVHSDTRNSGPCSALCRQFLCESCDGAKQPTNPGHCHHREYVAESALRNRLRNRSDTKKAEMPRCNGRKYSPGLNSNHFTATRKEVSVSTATTAATTSATVTASTATGCGASTGSAGRRKS